MVLINLIGTICDSFKPLDFTIVDPCACCEMVTKNSAIFFTNFD